MSEWISVEDRLPEGCVDTLLVAVTREEPLPISGETRFTDTDGFEYGAFCFWGSRPDSRITHWMPLPSPPENKE